MENTLGLEIIEVVEQAAIASAHWMGKGDKNTADHVAVEAMRERMNNIYMRGRIVIGEGNGTKHPCFTSVKKWEFVPVKMPKLLQPRRTG